MPRPELTVGPADAHLPGRHRLVLQAAIDRVAQLGGGTVRLGPGRYDLRGPLRRRSRVSRRGAGDDTWLRKAAECSSVLRADSDWYEAVARVAYPSGFQVGDGVVFQGRTIDGGAEGLHRIKREIVGIEGDHLLLDQKLTQNYWATHESTCSTLFPLIWIEQARDVTIADLRLDGNRAENGLLDGNHAGCIFMQYAERVEVSNVTAHDYHGDGISWQVADEVRIVGCRSHDNANLGLHPGSGSQRPFIWGNDCHGNNIGLFFCWGVKQGVAEVNTLVDNRHYGISIGHRDTDNVIRANMIERNGKAGIYFRPEQPAVRLPHHNRILDNRIADNGADDSHCGIWLRDAVDDTVVQGNTIVDTGRQQQHVGIRIDKEVGRVTMADNRFEGLFNATEDFREAAE